MSKKVTVILIVVTVGFHTSFGLVSGGTLINDGQIKLTSNGGSSLTSINFNRLRTDQDDDNDLNALFANNEKQTEKFYGEKIHLADLKNNSKTSNSANRPRAPPIIV